MKIVGIVCDNFKLSKFKKELTKKGFTDFEVVPFTPSTTTIKVKVLDDKAVNEIGKLCQLVEIHFNQSN